MSYRETSYLLEEGKDFTQEDLNESKLDLSNKFKSNFYKLGIGSLEWVGVYQADTKTIHVIVKEELFI